MSIKRICSVFILTESWIISVSCRLKEESIALIERFRPQVLKLDFASVTFVDSTGIGYVLARYRQMQKLHGEVVICNLSDVNKKIFEMSGIFQIIRCEKSEGRK